MIINNKTIIGLKYIKIRKAPKQRKINNKIIKLNKKMIKMFNIVTIIIKANNKG